VLSPGFSVVVPSVIVADGLSVTLRLDTCTPVLLVTEPPKVTSISSRPLTGTISTEHILVIANAPTGGTQVEPNGVGHVPHAVCAVPPESVHVVMALPLLSVASRNTLLACVLDSVLALKLPL